MQPKFQMGSATVPVAVRGVPASNPSGFCVGSATVPVAVRGVLASNPSGFCVGSATVPVAVRGVPASNPSGQFATRRREQHTRRACSLFGNPRLLHPQQTRKKHKITKRTQNEPPSDIIFLFMTLFHHFHQIVRFSAQFLSFCLQPNPTQSNLIQPNPSIFLNGSDIANTCPIQSLTLK